MLRWTDGPKEAGCVYHKRGVCPLGADSLVVDVYIMPSIAKQRPIAITLGRYRHDKPMKNEQWQLRSPDDLSSVGQEVPGLLEKLGMRADTSILASTEIEQLLVQEATTLKNVLGRL